MFRIDTPNKAVDLFGAGKHGFRDGDIALGINPTELSADQQNALQEELAGVIEAAGLMLSKANNAQLVEAIKRLIDAQSGNYALDTGAANAYVVALDPAIVAYADGMTVRVKAVNANTGASTLNAGGGAKSLVSDTGAALAAGDIPAASIFTATYILAADKFYVTSMVQSQGDARYAKLAGLATQLFLCADGGAGKEAVNISQFGNALAATGYQRLPGGLILQWGGVTYTSSGTQTWTYPIAFPNYAIMTMSSIRLGGAASYASNLISQTDQAPGLTSAKFYLPAGAVAYNAWVLALGY
ncbi:MAG: hypothetical protein WCZ98_02015 [Sideroxydans sp.]